MTNRFVLTDAGRTYLPRAGSTRAWRWPLVVALAGLPDGVQRLAAGIDAGRRCGLHYSGSVRSMLERWAEKDGLIRFEE